MITKKGLRPLAENIENFIYANDMNRQTFADELNCRLEGKGINEKIYSANDIWTYSCRGSLPRNEHVLAAISTIIGKSLEELLTTSFEMEELKRKTINNSCPTTPRLVDRTWRIERLEELTEAEQMFLWALIGDRIVDEDGKLCASLHIRLRYNQWKSVNATIYYGADKNARELEYEWSWEEFSADMRELDDESFIIEMKLEDQLYDKLYSVGLVKRTFCYSCAEDEDADEDNRFANTDGHFISEILFNIDTKEADEIVIEICRKMIEISKRKLD